MTVLRKLKNILPLLLLAAAIICVAAIVIYGTSDSAGREYEQMMLLDKYIPDTTSEKVVSLFFADGALHYSDGAGGVFRYDEENDRGEFIAQTEAAGGVMLYRAGSLWFTDGYNLYRRRDIAGESEVTASVFAPPEGVEKSNLMALILKTYGESPRVLFHILSFEIRDDVRIGKRVTFEYDPESDTLEQTDRMDDAEIAWSPAGAERSIYYDAIYARDFENERLAVYEPQIERFTLYDYIPE